jgi:hypothetical protein
LEYTTAPTTSETRTTIWGFLWLATFCRKLKYLTFSFNGTEQIPPDELALAANHELAFLNVGDSRLDELEDVVEFMSVVFPTLFKISHFSWNDETERKWNQVEELRYRSGHLRRRHRLTTVIHVIWKLFYMTNLLHSILPFEISPSKTRLKASCSQSCSPIRVGKGQLLEKQTIQTYGFLFNFGLLFNQLMLKPYLDSLRTFDYWIQGRVRCYYQLLDADSSDCLVSPGTP